MTMFEGSQAGSLDQSISCAADSPAKTSHRRDARRASRALARAFGLNSPALLGYFDPGTFLLRTCQASLFQEHFPEWLEVWPNAGMWDLGSVSELLTSEPLTSASESSLWPTAVSTDSESAARGTTTTGIAHPGVSLTDAISNWQTPGTDSFRSRGGERKEEMGLDQQARYFPSPAARDYRTPNKRTYQERGGRTKGEQLQNFVEHSLPAPTIPDGSESSPSGQISHRLSPRFVEWLMGFPPTWSEL